MGNSGNNNYPLLKIYGIVASLKNAEKKLAEYILENPKTTINSTIEELAEKSKSSYATISRFAKKLGYSGYKDLKKNLLDDILLNNSEDLTSNSYNFDENTTIESAIEKTFALSHKILTECESFTVNSEMEKATSAILNSKKVLIVGSGTSGLSAQYAYLKIFRLGINCKAETDPVIYSMEASLLEEEDVFIGVSSSGRTTSIVDAAKIALEKKATIISLSDYAISPLNKIADINLHTTPRNTNLFKNLEMPLLIGQISLIDILFSLLCLNKPALVDTFYRDTKRTADQLKL